MLKNTIIKNILLSICGLTAIGTVGTTIYNTIQTDQLKNDNQEIITTIEEKNNKIDELQKQLDETKTLLNETSEKNKQEITEETTTTTPIPQTSETQISTKESSNNSSYEATREAKKQELIKQRDELQKQIDNKKIELENQTQSLKEQADPLYNKYLELKSKASNELSQNGNTIQYKQLFQEQQNYERQYKEIDQKIFDLKYNSQLHNDIINLSDQLQNMQQQINEL